MHHAVQVYGSAKPGQASNNVVNLAATWELFQMHNTITNLTVTARPGWPSDADTSINFEAICYRNQVGACGFDGCARLLARTHLTSFLASLR